ncbi:DUF2937 family protein [Tropicibacter oceani]|uniref:DUF2937 family protein n=1 Tax=Tropicibacter oceani TaxID=3058420 RepID=A0ABY8QCI1_9RHOB|nr:DUF2937 family protein [Tropicibacter oceani]WGW02265.1 DUF2937 family protein [Tropicibacter oceani]
MIFRALALAGGVTGAAGLSQFPEFSQQYMQRLGGAVDELSRQVTRYERDAETVGVTLDELIDQLGQEGALSLRQAQNMRADIARRDQLAGDLATLEGAGPFMRAKLATHLGDRDIAKRALENFKPAAPLTFEGAVFAGTGFVTGWMGLSALFAFLAGGWAVLSAPFRRKSRV